MVNGEVIATRMASIPMKGQRSMPLHHTWLSMTSSHGRAAGCEGGTSKSNPAQPALPTSSSSSFGWRPGKVMGFMIALFFMAPSIFEAWAANMLNPPSMASQSRTQRAVFVVAFESRSGFVESCSSTVAKLRASEAHFPMHSAMAFGKPPPTRALTILHFL